MKNSNSKSISMEIKAYIKPLEKQSSKTIFPIKTYALFPST